jgi:ADP-ribose pyrophosphatase
MDFEILKRKKVYEGHIFDVENVGTRLPDGREYEYNLVVHAAAVTLVPVDARGNIWFVRQWRIGAGQNLLELPAGVLDDGEDPQTAAGRELREEIGMAAGRIRGLGDFYMVPGYSTEHMYIFLAQDLTDSPLDQDEDEFIEVEKIPVEQVLAMLQRGEFKDGKTIASLCLAMPYLKS